MDRGYGSQSFKDESKKGILSHRYRSMPGGRDYVPTQLRLVGEAGVEYIYKKLRISDFIINLLVEILFLDEKK